MKRKLHPLILEGTCSLKVELLCFAFAFAFALALALRKVLESAEDMLHSVQLPHVDALSS